MIAELHREYLNRCQHSSTGTPSGTCCGMGLPFCVADIPEEKAANIALGTVASKARAALIDACAAYRESDSQVS